MALALPTADSPARPRRARLGRLARRCALSVVLSAGLVGLAPASAGAADLSSAVRIASSVFPSVAQRCGTVKIEVAELSPYNAGASAESYFSLCKVRFAPDTLVTASQGQLCSLTIHEWGHLAGLKHSTDPNNFMYPNVPHNPLCGPADEVLDAAAARIDERASRREAIADKLVELRSALRSARKAHRRARGSHRAAVGRRIKRLTARITRLKKELRTLP